MSGASSSVACAPSIATAPPTRQAFQHSLKRSLGEPIALDNQSEEDMLLVGAQKLLMKMVHDKMGEPKEPATQPFRNRLLGVCEHSLTAQVVTRKGVVTVDICPGPGHWAVAPVDDELITCPIPNRMLDKVLRAQCHAMLSKKPRLATTPKNEDSTLPKEEQVVDENVEDSTLPNEEQSVDENGAGPSHVSKYRYISMYYIASEKRRMPCIAIRRQGCPGFNDQVGSAQIPCSISKAAAQSMAQQICSWVERGHQREEDIGDLLQMGVKHLLSQMTGI